MPHPHVLPPLTRLYAKRTTVIALMLSMAGAASATVTANMRSLSEAAADAMGARDAKPRLELREVMGKGADIDGDGAADFVNPTGEGVRQVDDFGSGAFHASRDGGSREHAGADYLARAGQTVVAPISGYVTRIGYAYANDAALRYVELTNAALGYEARVFYVSPTVAVGDAVRLGRAIGVALSLQGRYPGISDHVHVETSRVGSGHVDPTALIPTPTLRLARVGAGPAG